MQRFNFTKASLEALEIPVAGKRNNYSDGKERALQIRVSSTGSKSFSVYRRVKGGLPERITLGQYPALTIEQARRKASAINAAIEGGANPAQAKRAHKAEMTFGDLFAKYMANHALPTKITADEDERQYLQYIKPVMANRKISTITRAMVASLHMEITRAGHPVQANRVVSLVSTVFGRGMNWGDVDMNPALRIRRNRENSRERFLLADELPRFFAALEEEENTTMRDFMRLSLFTGVRRANMLEMRWADLSLNEGEWRIVRTKNGTTHTVTLSPQAANILAERKSTAAEGAIFVFPGDGASGHLTPPKSGWKRLLHRSDLRDVTLHDLRRTLGSWQAMTGASLVIIGKSLNQKSAKSTAIYARLDQDPVRASVDRATTAMMNAGATSNSEQPIIKKS